MALKEKKGGPYTKKEQETRRRYVYELYFEKGFSAVSIANKLDVNRNTVNEDIKYWQMQFASQLKDYDLGGVILSQIERSEIQKKRLLDQLDSAEIEVRLKIEKMISDIEYRITSFVSKIAEKQIKIETEDIVTYEQAAEIFKKMVFSEIIKDPKDVSDDNVLKAILCATESDTKFANGVASVLHKMGLDMFRDNDSYETELDLVSFGDAKKLISEKEKNSLEQKSKEYKKKQEEAERLEEQARNRG